MPHGSEHFRGASSETFTGVPVPVTSPVPSVSHNGAKHLNIHRKPVLIDCVFSAHINRISSWRVVLTQLLCINFSFSLTAAARRMEMYREGLHQRENADKLWHSEVNGIAAPPPPQKKGVLKGALLQIELMLNFNKSIPEWLPTRTQHLMYSSGFRTNYAWMH